MGKRGCSWLLPGTEVFLKATFPCRGDHIREEPTPPKARAGSAQHRGVFESSFPCREERIGEQLEMLKAAQSQADSGAGPKALQQPSDSLPSVSFVL